MAKRDAKFGYQMKPAYNNLPTQRPRPTKEFLENYTSDDHYTRSRVEVEHSAGDCMKVVLLMVEQLMCIDNFQKNEIMALIESNIDRHFPEEDAE